MQLDLFAPLPTVDLAPLLVTELPDVGALIARIGTDEDWSDRTLSDVLELWYCLYDEYVTVLLEPRKQAEEWFKQNGLHYASASLSIRQHYKREHTALTDAKNLFDSILHGVYCQRMEALFAGARQKLIDQGLAEEAIDGCEEFFNDVFQRPAYADLGKRLPQLMNDLVAEFAKLTAGSEDV